jgi:hypothetical protein
MPSSVKKPGQLVYQCSPDQNQLPANHRDIRARLDNKSRLIRAMFSHEKLKEADAIRLCTISPGQDDVSCPDIFLVFPNAICIDEVDLRCQTHKIRKRTLSIAIFHIPSSVSVQATKPSHTPGGILQLWEDPMQWLGIGSNSEFAQSSQPFPPSSR